MTQTYAIREARPLDLAALLPLCIELWPKEPLAEMEPHMAATLNRQPLSTLPLVVFVASFGDGLVGFIEVGLRSHAEGCDGRRAVGFVEGWYVRPKHRSQGVGRALMARAEQWSRDHGAVEIASDTWIDHELSIEAHRALGFDIVERTVHFRKALMSAQTEPTAATPGDSSVQH